MITSTNEEKAFDEIQNHLRLKKKKNPPENEHRWNLPQYNKGHIQQTHSKYLSVVKN